jgi:UDPglucose 6-dehydrogenase
MKIVCLGTGYVGLVSCAVFAHLGHNVVGLDIDEKKINQLKKGRVTIYEPGLEELFGKHVNKNLEFTTSYETALKGADLIFICVGTPPKSDGSYDLKYVFAAAQSIAKNLTGYAVVVIKSTVPPSTTSKVKEIIFNNTKVDFDIASNPEFLREGSAVNDALHPSRIIFGVENKKAENYLRQAHKKLPGPVLITTPQSAQLIKYASNAMLATRISFINAIAILCDAVGADVKDVATGLGLDPRIGNSFLDAGLGYGGSCFPKDTWALISFAKTLGYDFNFLKQVDQVNNDQVDYFVNKIKRHFDGSLKGKLLTVLGLAFKPNTDDMREARSVLVIERLEKLGAVVRSFDPVVKGKFADAYQALSGSDGLVLVTEWQVFGELNFKRVKKLMRDPNVFDGRNFYDPTRMKKLGFNYIGIGQK